jgi:hypothetical protein
MEGQNIAPMPSAPGVTGHHLAGAVLGLPERLIEFIDTEFVLRNIKNTGDSGDSGDRTEIALFFRHHSVTS